LPHRSRDYHDCGLTGRSQRNDKDDDEPENGPVMNMICNPNWQQVAVVKMRCRARI
jgi:hypothetical protein